MENLNGKLTENALDLLNRRYFHLDEGETNWRQLTHRVGNSIAQAEETDELRKYWGEVYSGMIFDLLFIPSTPSLMNANLESTGQLSSCFVLPIEDNIESICKVDAQLSKIFQRNGGGGFNISTLRPHHSKVETSKGYSTGVVSFLKKYNFTGKQMTENNERKGAEKADLFCWHPDIHEFIHCKDDTSELKCMNISVMITDKFMKAVLADDDWYLKFPDYSWNKEIYNKEWDGDIEEWESKGYPVVIHEKLKARDLYKEMTTASWKTGEPGYTFFNALQKGNNNPHLGKILGTNPCSEFCNIPYSSCNLGSLNLLKIYSESKDLDDFFSKLGGYIYLAVRFLDDMISVNKLPVAEIQKVTDDIRPVGLGLMGYHHLLYKLGLTYGSKEANRFTEKLMDFYYTKALQASMHLAEEKGVYPAWEGSLWQQKTIKIRNCNVLSFAPTGSISFIVNTSPSTEPVFSLVMSRTLHDGTVYYVVDPVFEEYLQEKKLYSEALLEKVVANHGSCKGIKEIPLEAQKVFITAHDVSPDTHIEVLGIFQKYVDMSLSKTVNLANSAKVDDIMDLVIKSWQLGIKGFTVYRDGSREEQPLVIGKKEEKKVLINDTGYVDVSPAMEKAYGVRIKVKTGCGHLWLFFFVDSEHNLAEIWTQVSGGGCKANIESMSRLASLCFRGKIDPKHILDQMSSAFCKTSMDNVKSKSCGQVIAKEIKNFLDSNQTIIAVGRDRIDDVVNLLKTLPCSEPRELQEKFSRTLTNALITECATTIYNDSKDVCIDGGSHQMNGEGCPVCVKCGHSKCN